MSDLIFLTPVFKQMIWGGDRLGKEWGYDIPGDNTGECWAVSAHPNGDCPIEKGEFAGKTLSELWANHPELFGGVTGDRFPLLTKIIDAKQDLSIQVHPEDSYAKVHENGSLGKTECWYILDCPEGATLVVGHNAKDKADLEDMIRGGKWNDFIREMPVKKGDFIQIDPGTVHAIKGGILLLETQQNSDITYRVYDYDRLSDGKPRELHVDKSLDVIKVPAASAKESIRSMADLPANKVNELIRCAYYQVFQINVEEAFSFPMESPFLILSVIEGEGEVNSHPVKKGDHFIAPAGTKELSFTGKLSLIASTPC